MAVIDSGIDTAQEDLNPVLWTDAEDGSHFHGPAERIQKDIGADGAVIID